MFPEARIDVALRTEAGRVASVGMRSSRRVTAANLFAGRTPSEVARLLPTVFALCGTAQGLACRAAVAQALDMPPPQGRAGLLAETVSEHALGVLRDWPVMTGGIPDLAAARELRAALAQGRIATAQAVFDAAIGAPEDDIHAWVADGRTPAARLFAALFDQGLAGFGAAAPFRPMPAGGPPDLGQRLAADGSGAYAAAPDHQGAVYETGPLARQAEHPAVARLLHEYGAGIAARLAARLVEAASALRELAGLMHDSPGTIPDAGSGAGLGVVEAARGLLAHRVELKDGRVSGYRILAPTEWNFHPRGPLAEGLLGAVADDRLTRRAELLILALDPCVACSVTVE